MPVESSYEEELRRTKDYHFTQQRVQGYAATATPQLAASVTDYAQRHPAIDGKTAYALASAGHAPDSQVAQEVSRRKLNQRGGGFWSGGPAAIVGRAARGVIRNGLAVAESPFQLITGVGRDLASSGALGRAEAGFFAGAGTGAAVGAVSGAGAFSWLTAPVGALIGGAAGAGLGLAAGDVKGDSNNPFLQTTVGQMVDGKGLGGGYIPRGPAHEAMVKQQQAAASIHGHALTGGRLLADGLFTPGSREYNFASGIVDAALVTKFDPVIHAGAEVKALREQSKLFMESERLKTPLQRAFGMINSEAKVVDAEKVATEAVAHPDVMEWAGQMKDEKDAFKIWNSTGRKIPIDAANRIAAASTAQDVLTVVRSGIQEGSIAEKAAVRNGNPIATTMRGFRQNSRLLAEMPEGGLDLVQMNVKNSGKLEKAVARFDDWMKSASFPEELRAEHANSLMQVKNTTEAEAVVQKAVLGDLQSQLIERSGLKGEGWGWDKGKVDSILGGYAKVRDDLMSKLHDELGDALQGKPIALLDRRLEPMAKADTVSELLENVIPLPNTREVRRVMNPSESLSKIYGSESWKRSITLADHFMTKLWRPITLLRPAFTIRMLGEETARMVANGMDAPLMHPLSLISQLLTPSERISQAIGVTGDSLAASRHHATAMIDLEALDHDAGAMSKYMEVYKTATPEGSQAWAGKMLNAHNDELSRHLIDNGVESAKEWWWTGEGQALREDYTARTGKAFTKQQSDLQVDKQMKHIQDITGEHPALMHAISTGMIPTEMEAVQGPGIKWVSATKPTAEGEASIQELRSQAQELDKSLARTNAEMQDDLDYFQSHAHDQPDAPQSAQAYRAQLRKEKKALEKKIAAMGSQPGHWDQELEQPLYFHGTQEADAAGTLRSVQPENDRNLVGPGFYTTNDPEVASTYAKVPNLQATLETDRSELRMAQADLRGLAADASPELKARLEEEIQYLKDRVAQFEQRNPAVHRMTWRDPDNPPKMLNLEKPLPAPVRKVYEDALRDASEAVQVRPRNAKGHFVKAGPGATSKATIEKVLNDVVAMPSNTKGIDVVRRALEGLHDADKAEVLRVLQEAGHDGFTHTGGAITNSAPHEVSVFFDPHKLGPANNVVPKNVSYIPKPGERGIPLQRTDGRGIIHPEARDHLMKMALDPDVKTPLEMAGAKQVTKQYQGWTGRAVKSMFENLMALPSNELIRSPAFNQAYWDKMIDAMPLLTAEAKEAALASLEHPNAQVSSRVVNQMHRAATGSTGGIVALEDADMLAKGHALDFVSKTFEDLTGRSALDEAVRHIAPFARAWRESSKKWVRTFAQDPTAVRKFHRVLTAGGLGGEGQQGQGFFYKNDSDQWVFNYPASGLIGKIVGAPFPMQGGVAGATPSLGGATSGGMGHSLIPGVGPFVSIAASKFLPNTPTFDDAREWLAPYGDPTASGIAGAITPPWLRSMQKAFDSPDMAGMHANTVMDTARYLMSTGEYDTSTQEGQEKLLEDASKTGKHITILRGLAQLFSPSSPKLVPMAQDKDGHTVVARLLTEDMHNMQVKDFNGATEAFLDKYGDQGLLYLQGNSRSVNPGGTETDKGYDFLRSNPDLVRALPLTAGLFAPPDGEFEYAAYLRAIQVGDRQQLTPKQMVALANDKVGSMIYYNARDKLGAMAGKDEGRKALADIRSLLMDRFPGYGAVIGGLIEKAKTPQVIDELEKAVTLKKVQDTPVGQALTQYLKVRNKMNEVAQSRGLKTFAQSDKTADLRAATRDIAQMLISSVPGFALVYDRILDGEMKEDFSG